MSRNRRKERLEERLREIISRYDTDIHQELARPMRYIRRVIGDWFTCLDHPGMPATNNLAKQVIREHVIQRKI